MTSVSLATFLAGVGVGLAVAVPIGPMGILCIQRTLAFGLMAGVATGLAGATVQVTYGLVAVLGLSPTALALVGTGASLLSLFSAALLFWFAYRIMRREVVLGLSSPQGPRRFLRSYGDALTFGFTNPLTVLLFFAAFPAVASAEDFVKAPVLVGGVFAGAVGWYIALSGVAAVLRERVSARALRATNLLSGLTLGVLGAFMLANALGLRAL